jgi:hypothetical protein
VRVRRDERFESLVRELGRELGAPDGWRLDERVINGCTFARDLDPPLSAVVDLLFEPDEETGQPVLGGLVAVRCVPAQELLDRLGAHAPAVIERMLVTDAREFVAIELTPDLPLRETARTLSAVVRAASLELVADAGTVDDFLRCRAVDPDGAGGADGVTAAVLAVSGRTEEARAVLAEMRAPSDAEFVERFTAWLAGEFVPDDDHGSTAPPMPSWADAAARVQARREALAAMEGLGPSAGLDARRAVLVAELSARGLAETPYWIERRSTRERLAGAAGFTRLVRDAVSALRGIGDDDAGDGEPIRAPGRGPWIRVTLAPGADAALDRAFNNATRIGDLAPVHVRLRSADEDAAIVMLDGAEVGRLEHAPGVWDDTPVRAEIGRLPSSPPYLLQLQLP